MDDIKGMNRIHERSIMAKSISGQPSARRRSLIAGIGVSVLLAAAFVLSPGRPVPRNSPLSPKFVALRTVKNLGLGVGNFASGRGGHIPPAGIGQAVHSWQTDLLLVLDYANLYRAINRDVPWDDPSNRKIFQTKLSLYQVPWYGKAAIDGYGPAHFAMNDRLWNPVAPPSLTEIVEKDGLEGTLLIASTNGRERPWGDPAGAARDLTRGINRSSDGFGSHGKADSTVVVMASGAGRILSDNISPRVLEQLANPSDGEPAEWPE